jgi:hypothetical protein
LRRPTGVLVAATILGIFTVFNLIGILGLGFAVEISSAWSNPNLHAAKHFFAIFGVIWICYLAFCVFVVVGLVRMQSWARICISILGALKLVFWSLMAIGMVGLRNRMPETSPATLSVHSTFWIVLALIYASIAMIGLWWVVYFNLKSVRRSFTERNSESLIVEGAVVQGYTFWHVVVIVLAWLLLIGGLWMLAMSFLQVPFWFLGFTFRGTAAVSLELIYAALAVYSGIGLLRRSRTAFKTAIVLQAICLLSSCIALFPSATRQLWATSLEINQRFGIPASSQFAESHSALIRVVQVFTLAMISFCLYALFRCRNVFEGRELESASDIPID